jgi:hypothetical protein
MEQALNCVSSFLNLYGISALVILCIGVYLKFNQKAKQEQLAERRARFVGMQSSDPQSGQGALHFNDD